MIDVTILDLCAGSGEWSRPYHEAGYRVLKLDLPDDIRLLKRIDKPVHGILCAPPCTVFASSGARWPRSKEHMIEGLSVVDACFRAITIYSPAWWVLENPIGKLTQYLGKPAHYFQPYEYGDPYFKRTCLWGRFAMPKKTPVEPIEGGKIHRMGPSPDRTAKRSVTPRGFAKAFFKANP